eukprot:SAG25_NODE_484_length_7474_cov_11.267823_4_plen_111_part_00
MWTWCCRFWLRARAPTKITVVARCGTTTVGQPHPDTAYRPCTYTKHAFPDPLLQSLIALTVRYRDRYCRQLLLGENHVRRVLQKLRKVHLRDMPLRLCHRDEIGEILRRA